MDELFRRRLGARTVVIGATDRHDGDVHPGRVRVDELDQRQRSLVGRRWLMLDQQHGADVHVVDVEETASWPLAGTGDVLVAPDDVSVPLAVWAADCAPIVLLGVSGARVVAHAGWRGLAAGVVDAAVDALESADGGVEAAVLGPCIHPCCYEFGVRELAELSIELGVERSEVVATTTWGASALDVPATVRVLLARRGVRLDVVGDCTGCEPRFQSHRRRRDPARHAVVTWVEDAA